MKKLICLLGHNKHLLKLSELTREDFENENQAISVYTCKYCGKFIFTRIRYVNVHPKKLHFEKSDDLF